MLASSRSYHCGSLRLIRPGKAPGSKQKLRCKTCGQGSREKLLPAFSARASHQHVKYIIRT